MTRPKLYPNKVAGHNRWICIGLSCFNQLQGESAARLEYGAFFISGPREDACVVDLVLGLLSYSVVPCILDSFIYNV